MKQQQCGLLKQRHLDSKGSFKGYSYREFDKKLFERGFDEFLKNKYMSDKLRLFQYAAILHTKTTDDKGKVSWSSEIILEPKTVLAKSDKDVLFRATREIPEDKAGDPDNVEIIVRPF